MNRKWKTLVAAGLLAAFLPVGAFAQFGGKKKTQDEKTAEAEQKNQVTYETVKQYSLAKYQADKNFKEAVDADFDELLRDHKAVAYDHNIRRGSKVIAIHEDRFRLHEGLYDNLLVQAHINRIGQSLVPKDSDRVFAFRLLPDPTPNAETLATGTVYISTGMLSLLDNEAQVAYVLAHETAHVQLEHWKQKFIVKHGVEAYNAEQAKKPEKTAMYAAIGGGILGGIIGKGAGGAIAGAVAGAAAGAIVGSMMNRAAVVEWDLAQENEADELAFKLLMAAKYDVREVPKLYVAIENVSAHDSRATLGFLGQRNRVKQRRENTEKLLADGAIKAEVEGRLKAGDFNGDSAEHRNLMAELKRDNGIMAYYNDMFTVARKNLEEAVAIRANDPAAQYYLGKVLETIGRTPEDRQAAQTAFANSVKYDDLRNNFGAHLHYALLMIGDPSVSNNDQIAHELDTYVTDYVKYQIQYAQSTLLPPNLETIYEFMKVFGKLDWKPQVPDEAKDVRVMPAALPTSGTELANKPASTGPAKQTPPAQKGLKDLPCPPGMNPAACAAAKAGAGMIPVKK
jgi:predicted Zn-dependent protease